MSNIRQINLKFDYYIGDVVYVKTDIDQFERIVTRVMISENNIEYDVSLGSDSAWYYGFELSKEKNVLKSLGC